MPQLTITNEQRGPIYEQLRRHLASLDDVPVFADADPEEAGRRALQYADDFRLFEDLGWDRDGRRDSIRLTMPPIDLRRALMRLQGGSRRRADLERRGRTGGGGKARRDT